VRLTYVQIEITTRCNAACTYCDNSRRVSKHFVEDMAPKLFGKLLDKIGGVAPLVHLQGVGEPFLHPQLPAILHACKSRSFATSTTTNGSIKNTEVLSLIDTLYVSLDSVNSWPEHQRIGIQPERTVDWLEWLEGQMRRPKVFVNTVISGKNLPQLRELLMFVGKKNNLIEGIILSPLLDFTATKPSLDPPTRRELAKVLADYTDLNINANFLMPSSGKNCGWPTDKLYFDVNGWVRTCCIRTSCQDVFFGNIFQHGIRNVINDPALTALAKRHSIGRYDSICKKCMANGNYAIWNNVNG